MKPLPLQRRFRKFLYDSLNSHRKDSHLFHAFRRANRHKVQHLRACFDTRHRLIDAIIVIQILMAEIQKSQSKRQWAQLKSGVFGTRIFNSTHKKYEVRMQNGVARMKLLRCVRLRAVLLLLLQASRILCYYLCIHENYCSWIITKKYWMCFDLPCFARVNKLVNKVHLINGRRRSPQKHWKS